MGKIKRRRRYLNDLGEIGACLDVEKCGRGDYWKRQRCNYGFDERDTWSLKSTMVELLYERVKMFMEVHCIDLHFHRIEIGGEIKTQIEWIEELLSECEAFITDKTPEVNENRI